MKLRAFGSLILAAATIIVSGCGGGGGGGPAAPTTTVVSGVVSKGSVGGAQVTVFAITGGAKGAQLATAVSSAGTDGRSKGAYTVDLGTYTGPVLVEATGGTYTDEASQQSRDLIGLTLRAAATSATTGTNPVQVTPLTEVAVQRMADFQAASINNANNAVASLFGVDDIIRTQPVDSNSSAAGSAPDAVKQYSLALATVSQYIENKGAGFGLANAITDISAAMNPATAAAAVDQTLTDIVAAKATAIADLAVNGTGLGAPVASATTATIKVKTSGTLSAGNIGGVQLSIILPSGVTVPVDVNNEIAAANLSASGVAASTTGTTQILAGSFTQAVGTTSPGKVRLIVANTPLGFQTGEFATLKCNVAAQSRVISSSFLVTDAVVTDAAGAPIGSIKVELAVTIP